MVSHAKPSQLDCRILWLLTSNISYYPKQRINLRLINWMLSGTLNHTGSCWDFPWVSLGHLGVKWDGINQNERFVCLFFLDEGQPAKFALAVADCQGFCRDELRFFMFLQKWLHLSKMFFSIKLSWCYLLIVLEKKTKDHIIKKKLFLFVVLLLFLLYLHKR